MLLGSEMSALFKRGAPEAFVFRAYCPLDPPGTHVWCSGMIIIGQLIKWSLIEIPLRYILESSLLNTCGWKMHGFQIDCDDEIIG